MTTKAKKEFDPLDFVTRDEERSKAEKRLAFDLDPNVFYPAAVKEMLAQKAFKGIPEPEKVAESISTPPDQIRDKKLLPHRDSMLEQARRWFNRQLGEKIGRDKSLALRITRDPRYRLHVVPK